MHCCLDAHVCCLRVVRGHCVCVQDQVAMVLVSLSRLKMDPINCQLLRLLISEVTTQSIPLPFITCISTPFYCLHPAPFYCLHPTPFYCLYTTPLYCLYTAPFDCLYTTPLYCLYTTPFYFISRRCSLDTSRITALLLISLSSCSFVIEVLTVPVTVPQPRLYPRL